MRIVPPLSEDPIARVTELLHGQAYNYVTLQMASPGRYPCIIALELDDVEIGRGEDPSPHVAQKLAAQAALPALESRHASRKAKRKSLLNPEERLRVILRQHMESFLNWIHGLRSPNSKERKRGARFMFPTKKNSTIYVTIKERPKSGHAGYFLWSPRANVIAFVPYDPCMKDDQLFADFHRAFEAFYNELAATPRLTLV